MLKARFSLSDQHKGVLARTIFGNEGARAEVERHGRSKRATQDAAQGQQSLASTGRTVPVGTFTDYFAVRTQHCALQTNRLGLGERYVAMTQPSSAYCVRLSEPLDERWQVIFGSSVAKRETSEIPDSQSVATGSAVNGGSNAEKICASFLLIAAIHLRSRLAWVSSIYGVRFSARPGSLTQSARSVRRRKAGPPT